MIPRRNGFCKASEVEVEAKRLKAVEEAFLAHGGNLEALNSSPREGNSPGSSRNERELHLDHPHHAVQEVAQVSTAITLHARQEVV